MTLTDAIANSMHSALPGSPQLMVTGVRLVLYRGAQPRPRENFYPVNLYHQPNSPYQFKTFFDENRICLEFITDGGSLRQRQPLRYYLDAFALDWHSMNFLWFYRTGGSGCGPGADAATLESLLEALRAFPGQWSREILIPLSRSQGDEGTPENDSPGLRFV